jgi:hypothetical protein
MNGRRYRNRRIGLISLPVVIIMVLVSLTSGASIVVLHDSYGLMESFSNLGYESGSNYWYVGVSSNESDFMSNQGIRGEIQVVPQQNTGSFLAFWVSETVSDGLWGQVGYYIFHDSTPLAFYQVWNLTSRQEINSGDMPVSLGNHLFSMSLTQGTIFEFSVDSLAIGHFVMGANSSSATDPVNALSEEGYCSSPFPFAPVSFSAIQVLRGGEWVSLTSAESYGNSWGMVGSSQDQFTVGGDQLPLSEGTPLWT